MHAFSTRNNPAFLSISNTSQPYSFLMTGMGGVQ
ncbi:hypothetical protein PF66_05255 [Pseudomonas asplenii]|uniref:Uncharacterized protein n=1 Tax=Pseudomonas asplenii TaxID=53407 RepID=A0A0N0VII2_9PSED|nr:hypothetical protein PF66_05255 [Pseudomonas fuscovaginae]